MFRKVLIANRGEIALRVIRACRELGVSSVAIYSEVDRRALHVRAADEAYLCGPAPATESYLDAARIIEIARGCGADAIHPGYGFLSENGDFADAVNAAGISFVGPSGAVMRQMGDKVTARQTMEAAGVPIVPGTTERLSDAQATEFAREIGFPVMVKASAGGGGKGLRQVEREEDLAAALERARSEAQASFGDDGLYIEKFVAGPRHIEVQILADSQGHVVHCFERECSIQRRHQKVLEEAPARITPELRAAMGDAAVAAARAVDYVGAGTVEFLLGSDGRFHFLEMNTRIQVEHAITEAITGVDLVAQGIRVAAGEALSFAQTDLEIRGHALEARIYAENPAKKFLPSPGRIAIYRAPGGPGVRVDSGVESGTEVTPYYDPMVAKLVVWAEDRDAAIARLERAISEFIVTGIHTSIPFHRWLMRNVSFRTGDYDTGFIDEVFDPKTLDEGIDPLAEQVATAVALGDHTNEPAWQVDEIADDHLSVIASGRHFEVATWPKGKRIEAWIQGHVLSVKPKS